MYTTATTAASTTTNNTVTANNTALIRSGRPQPQIPQGQKPFGAVPSLLSMVVPNASTISVPDTYTTSQGTNVTIPSIVSIIPESQDQESSDETIIAFQNPDIIIESGNNNNNSSQSNSLLINNSRSEIDANLPKRPSKRVPQVNTFKTVNSEGLKEIQYSAKDISMTSPKELGFNKHKGSYLDYLYKENLLNKNTPPPVATLVYSLSLDRFNEEVDSHRVISKLIPEHAHYVAFNRHVYYQQNSQATTEANQVMLGTDGSVLLDGGNKSPYIKPGNQVSIFQKTTMQNYSGKVVHNNVISVAMPVLNDKNIVKQSEVSPEMGIYLDTSTNPPTFNTEAYKTSIETICDHIVMTAESCGPNRVVFSAAGITDSLEALEAIDNMTRFTPHPTILKDTALGIAASAHAKMIKQLQEKNIRVYFMDMVTHSGKNSHFNNQKYWTIVNNVLKMISAKPLTVVNSESILSLPKDKEKIKESMSIDPLFWISENDLVVNPYNPKALVGDGITKGNSFNCWLGCRTTLNFVDSEATSKRNQEKSAEDRRSNFLKNKNL
jgi:hypothetical protein